MLGGLGPVLQVWKKRNKPSGKSSFVFLWTNCRARIYAQYNQKTKKLQGEEDPLVDKTTLCSESDHVLKDGTQYPVQLGLRLVEELWRRLMEAIREDPTRPVAKTYEAQMTEYFQNQNLIVLKLA